MKLYHATLDGIRVNVTPLSLAECAALIEKLASVFGGHRLDIAEAQL